MKQLYKNVVDEAVIAVSNGVVGYNKAISDTIKKTAVNGNVVEYASGLTRRRDSAVRMNVLEGIRQINAGISEATGKEFGSDGVEVSAHGLCAEDHITIQGQQYSNEEFERLKNSLDRPIGTLNCKHFTFPIILGISSPVYSKQELEARTKNSMEIIDIDGVQKTRYQWSQQQRRIETAVRTQKDIANIAKASGDDMLRRTAQNKINGYNDIYKKVCMGAGLEPKADRLSVRGFIGVVSSDKLAKKVLTEGVNSANIKLANKEVRKAYRDMVSTITGDLDKTKSLENQAKQAFGLRNKYRSNARKLMIDVEALKEIEKTKPNLTFEELIESKVRRKGLTRDEAIADVLETATKTNKDVDDLFK